MSQDNSIRSIDELLSDLQNIEVLLIHLINDVDNRVLEKHDLSFRTLSHLISASSLLNLAHGWLEL